MSYELLSTLQLGVNKAGLTLNADLIRYDGTMVASGVSTSFVEMGYGNYFWYYNAFPNDFRGVAKVYNANASASGWNVPLSINPEEAEYLDMRISDIPSGVNFGFGQNIVTFSVVDENSDPVPGARIEVYPSGNTSSLINLGHTGTNSGAVIFNLDSGNYDVYANKSAFGYFTNPTTVTVDSSHRAFTIGGTRFVIPTAPDSDLIRIYTFLNDIGLDPKAGVRMLVAPSGVIDFEEVTAITKKGLSASSDADGYVYLDVLPNFPLRAKIPDAGIDLYFMSPGSGTLNIATLID